MNRVAYKVAYESGSKRQVTSDAWGCVGVRQYGGVDRWRLDHIRTGRFIVDIEGRRAAVSVARTLAGRWGEGGESRDALTAKASLEKELRSWVMHMREHGYVPLGRWKKARPEESNASNPPSGDENG